MQHFEAYRSGGFSTFSPAVMFPVQDRCEYIRVRFGAAIPGGDDPEPETSPPATHRQQLQFVQV